MFEMTRMPLGRSTNCGRRYQTMPHATGPRPQLAASGSGAR
jgi:hypothetical protein